MPLSTDKFANAAHGQANSYERRFRKYVPFMELVDVLRRQAAFDIPLTFVLDRDSESSGFFKRGPQWDFGEAGVRFEKTEGDSARPTLVVTWSDEYERKTLQGVLEELMALGFADDDEVCLELVSPTGERRLSRFGNGLTVEKDNTILHFTGAWEKR